MKKLLLLARVLALPLTASVPALSQSAFEGTWKFDIGSSKLSSKPDVYLLQNGIYSCKTCPFPFEVKADGKDHPVPPNPYYDTANIRIVDDPARHVRPERGAQEAQVIQFVEPLRKSVPPSLVHPSSRSR